MAGLPIEIDDPRRTVRTCLWVGRRVTATDTSFEDGAIFNVSDLG